MPTQSLSTKPTATPHEVGDDEERSASDIVFAGILSGLELQRFVPGQRLVEADLAERFQVGRNSVREALQRLSAEGLVEILRHKGAMIRLLTLQETMDVLEVAEQMTGLLAKSAARGKKSLDDLRLLKTSVKDLAPSHRVHDLEAFSKARRTYYRALLRLSGNKELRRIFPAIQMPIVHAQYRPKGLQEIRVTDYRRIAEAVLAGDPVAAEAAGIAHVANVRAAIVASQVGH